MFQPLNVDAQIFRGPQPQIDDDWTELKNLGIKHVLDLETGAVILADGSPLKQQLIGDERGVRVWNHPLSELIFPTWDQLNQAVNFLRAHRDEGVYVHCKAGVDRTGIVVAAYRIVVNGWDKDKAVAEMHARGMHPWYYPWQTIL